MLMEEEESRVAAVDAIVEAVGDDDVVTVVEKVAAVLLAGRLKPLLLQPRPELATAMDCRILAVSESGFRGYGWQNLGYGWQNLGCVRVSGLHGYRWQNLGCVGVGVSRLWMEESCRGFTAMDGRILTGFHSYGWQNLVGVSQLWMAESWRGFTAIDGRILALLESGFQAAGCRI